jgi:NAD-dependent DNA ligase
MLDDHAADLFAKNINMMVPYYLMASFAYYKQDNPIFSDSFFDNMAKTMLHCWSDIEHRHKHLINTDDLSAGTYLGEYPSIVEGALEDLRKQHAT